MSDDDNERDSGGQGAANTFDLGPEWGPARIDRRHQFNGYALFFLPRNSTSPRASGSCPGGRSTRRSARDAQQRSQQHRSALQRARRAVPAQRVPQRGVQGSQPARAVGVELRGGDARALHVRSCSTCSTGTTSSCRATPVTNYCAGTAPADCGFGAPTNPNFLSLTDNNPTSATSGQLITETTRARRGRCSSASGSSSEKASGSRRQVAVLTRRPPGHTGRPFSFTALPAVSWFEPAVRSNPRALNPRDSLDCSAGGPVHAPPGRCRPARRCCGRVRDRRAPGATGGARDDRLPDLADRTCTGRVRTRRLLLHSFEYEDAKEAFQQAQKAAPDFAMAYWGEAMTYNHPLWSETAPEPAREAFGQLAADARAALAKAGERQGADGFAPSRRSTVRERSRRATCALRRRNAPDERRSIPTDLEVKAFYALALLGTATAGATSAPT